MDKRAIIYGGKGGLGSVLVSHFKSENWWILSIDLSKNDQADENIMVPLELDWCKQEEYVCQEVKKLLGSQKIEAIINVAGGWAGGNAKSPDMIKNADLMWKQSVWSSTISGVLAAEYLKESGCLILPGAQPALEGTPGMIGYGLAKAAVHQLVKSLASADSGLPRGAFVAAILPITLDTPMNRKFMPNADFTTWTKLEFLASLMRQWAQGEKRTKNGNLVQLVTKNNETSLVVD